MSTRSIIAVKENGTKVKFVCENNKLRLPINQVEKFLEADIIHRWEEYDVKYKK